MLVFRVTTDNFVPLKVERRIRCIRSEEESGGHSTSDYDPVETKFQGGLGNEEEV
jgi:hypothetical protein